MSIELRIPEVGESVREVQIGRWLKREGDSVEQDENLVELETDKASIELPAPIAGVIGKILKHEGEVVVVGDVIGYLESERSSFQEETETTPSKPRKASSQQNESVPKGRTSQPAKRSSPLVESTGNIIDSSLHPATLPTQKIDKPHEELPVTPAARRELRAHGLTAVDIKAAGPRIDREEVLRHVKKHEGQFHTDGEVTRETDPVEGKAEFELANREIEEIVPMSLIRRRIAERLVHAQQQAALLTTFNEIDMSAVKELRETYRDSFQAKYGAKLGFTSFFVKAVIDALKEQPGLNAEIRDNQIAYRQHYHIGIAIGSAKGLVVPVLRFAEQMSFAEIEQAVENFAHRAAANKLEPQELEGGTFTITNGGVYGSLLSTPIVNPPQSGILGMHFIQDRPVARGGQVVIRPMMYVALTYDHRLVDGREAVSFLKRIKDTIEDPSRMLLEV